MASPFTVPLSLAGFIAASRYDQLALGLPCLHLDQVDTVPELWRLNVFKELLRQLVRHPQLVDVEHVTLCVDPLNNPGAQAAYRAVGFAHVEPATPVSASDNAVYVMKGDGLKALRAQAESLLKTATCPQLAFTTLADGCELNEQVMEAACSAAGSRQPSQERAVCLMIRSLCATNLTKYVTLLNTTKAQREAEALRRLTGAGGGRVFYLAAVLPRVQLECARARCCVREAINDAHCNDTELRAVIAAWERRCSLADAQDAAHARLLAQV